MYAQGPDLGTYESVVSGVDSRQSMGKLTARAKKRSDRAWNARRLS